MGENFNSAVTQRLHSMVQLQAAQTLFTELGRAWNRAEYLNRSCRRATKHAHREYPAQHFSLQLKPFDKPASAQSLPQFGEHLMHFQKKELFSLSAPGNYVNKLFDYPQMMLF